MSSYIRDEMEERAAPRIKNKAPSAIQISAEQLLREAFDRQEAPTVKGPTNIRDLEELQEFQGRKRREFENGIRRNRLSMGNWMRYAQWELDQKDFARARSVFERALDVDARHVPLWLKYIECEMKHRNINHTRNLFDRVVTLLPRVDKFWFKYAYMEETLGNVAGTRAIFERWMSWEPDEGAWMAYVNFEKRYKEFSRARHVFERFTVVHPEPKNWLRWARFEEDAGSSEGVREVFTQAIDFLGDDFMDEKVFIAFARYECKVKEYERARVVYKYALDRMPRSKSAALNDSYTAFEKQYGDRDGIEDVIIAKRRLQYEEQLRENPKNFDIWFDFARLEETTSDHERTREAYERAIAQVPPTQEKRHWRRYIFLWLNYAIFEELETKDYDRARQIYKACLKLIPHKEFTFAKVWLQAANFEVRMLQVGNARKLLGQAIGACPKTKLFKGYIEMEMLLREYERVRKVYEKFLEFDPSNVYAWVKYAELEIAMEENNRWRAIYELAIEQDLDMPEVLWKSYIDAESESEEEGSVQRTRRLYERLLEKTNHVKVWMSFAQFENTVQDETDTELSGASDRARSVFLKAYERMREQSLKEERIVLLEAWKQFETANGTEQSLRQVEDRMPAIVKRSRALEDGTSEEYLDYIFNDNKDADGQEAKNFKMLQMAKAWKEKQQLLLLQQQSSKT